MSDRLCASVHRTSSGAKATDALVFVVFVFTSVSQSTSINRNEWMQNEHQCHESWSRHIAWHMSFCRWPTDSLHSKANAVLQFPIVTAQCRLRVAHSWLVSINWTPNTIRAHTCDNQCYLLTYRLGWYASCMWNVVLCALISAILWRERAVVGCVCCDCIHSSHRNRIAKRRLARTLTCRSH